MPKIMIAVPTGESTRRAEFYDYFNQIEKPEGTVISFVHGQSPAKSRNTMIDQAKEHNCTHIFFLDDDMHPPSNILSKLIAHDKDVVTGLYLMRNFPHMPVIFDEAYEDGQCKFTFLDKHKNGLLPIVNCGLGCVLINMNVFEGMQKPYVRLGEIFKDEWCDDIGFFNRVREAGFNLYCDLSVLVGHQLGVTMYPVQDELGNWLTEYRSPNGNIRFPQNIPTPEEIEKQKREVVGAGK